MSLSQANRQRDASSNSNFTNSYTVSYNSSSHWSVITQMWGSQWPKVLPYCLFNVALMVLLMVLDRRYGYKVVEISNQGHTFVTLVVSFLLVSRVNMALTRYVATRDAIETMLREVRELVQNVCVLSSTLKDGRTMVAEEWRHEMAYRALLLLRTTMVAVEYPINQTLPWTIPELNGMEANDIKNNLLSITNAPSAASSSNNRNYNAVWEDVLRVPIRIEYLLRKSVHSNTIRLTEPIPIQLELKVFTSIDNFMNGYYNMRKFLTTPVPFPLIQMSRTLMFTYVFTVPFVMLSDKSSDFAHCFIVFLLTYGFMGLEMIAMELDNPFGDDANDLNLSALAAAAYDDVYLTILDVDGSKWRDKLRSRIVFSPVPNNANPSNEQTDLLLSV